MGKRSRIWTALLLSAAMVMGSISPGFAAEIADVASVSEDAAAVESPEQEGVEYEADTAETGGSEDADELKAADEAEKAAAEGADEETGEVSENDLVSEEPAEEEAPKTEEKAEESVPGEVVSERTEEKEPEADKEKKAESGVKADLDEETVRSYTTIENSKEYDGNEYTPKYTVPEGHKIVSQNKKDSPALALNNRTFTFPAIKFVSESQTFYVYPDGAEKDEDYDFLVKASITRRPVTFKSGTYTKEYDGKTLSQASAPGAERPWIVKGSMVGTESFVFEFDPEAKITEPGSVKNKFTVSKNGSVADINNYDVSYEYGDLIISEERGPVNSLPEPTKVKATINKKGDVKLTWKKVKSYKEAGKKGGKTAYKIYRYNSDGTWKKLTEGLYKTKFIDKSPSEGEKLIYKIIPVGMDYSGVSGEAEKPAYVRVTPKIVSVTPADGIHYANVNFMGFGSDSDKYTIQHYNNKSKGIKDEVVVTKYNSTWSKYVLKTRTISTNSYLDAGGDNVTISGNNKATFTFRVKAEETVIYDYGHRVDLEDSAWSRPAKLKLISMAPYLKGQRKSNTAFTLKWNKISKATGYLIEYSKDSRFAALHTTKVYTSLDEKPKYFENREYTVEDVGVGVPYYCRVTAYLKKKNDGTEFGTELGTSNVLIQYGRQKAVTNLKALYFEDGNARADAKLTWSDTADNISGYYIQRWSYAYNSTTKQYDKETGHAVLQGYVSDNSTKKRYANTVGGRIENGELIKYRVQSVWHVGGTAGEYHDGYVFSDPVEYFYMNPSEVDLTKTKYSVKVDGTVTPTYKIKPKKLPKKADGYTQSEFKEIFEFNDDMEFVLKSDSLTTSEIKKYVTVDGDSGKLKGIKVHKSSDIYMKISSPNDPTNVCDEARVYVVEDGENEGKEREKSSSLVVCIDPGHGGKDSGTTHNDIVEKDVNLKIAKMLRDELKDKGAKVYMTRTDDSYVSLTDRTDIADDKNCNLFVSVHCNYNDDTSKRGTEVYYSVKSEFAKKKLSAAISAAVSDALDTKDRGALTRQGSDGDYYSVIRTSAAKGIPGIIVEHAFVSNSKDAEALKNDDLLRKAAKAEAQAIIDNWKK